ncbi:non-oxidative hydroxyarylic acid decarboxylases subunit D [Desulfolutivibrio sulfoxidireducens]|uniref:non-oxidative hydroxyarylic acid decarboxylases subunit D n=1 Tax=Desulfolutivibrio sulfoxidireducens TaxID=2773299 RepID=UPI00159E30A6|nr:non-oxidative hydroxyarylic acid decarboxylases subunit D [Desulfolutivibrio sulfoxidireducens]QLA20807.1 vanillic acid non-oxidative decarboxylation protein [Desulfolutivibrio sulfoxidireducens]
MKCIRCLSGEASVVAKAPDGSGAWEIYKCARCNFGWRNTEPAKLLDPATRDPFFQLDKVDIDKLLTPCPIPPLNR